MKYKQYKFYKLLIVVILAMIVSIFVTSGNFIIPLAVLLVAVILMFMLNRSLNEVITDERVEKIAGKSARLTYTITVILMALAGLVLIALRDTYPEYYVVGNVLAYIACGMLFLYAIFFKYFSRKG